MHDALFVSLVNSKTWGLAYVLSLINTCVLHESKDKHMLLVCLVITRYLEHIIGSLVITYCLQHILAACEVPCVLSIARSHA
jgi:hypothetical protein